MSDLRPKAYNAFDVYTRDLFERQRARVKAVERVEGRLLVAASVGLGFAQLAFLWWADTHLDRHLKTAVAGSFFLAYLALVGWLLWRFQVRLRAARAKCPHCGVMLEDMSERVAAATGRCDRCGGQVIEG